jgi:hypothetical protein
MDNLRRLGGEAGVLAGIAMAWLFLGLVLVFPSAGLSVVQQANPHRYISFIANHEAIFWAVNVLGGFVAGVFSAVLILALGDRFREASPGSTRIATEFGVVGAAAFASAAIVRQVGFSSLTAIYKATTSGGAAAFYAMNGVVDALLAFSGIAMGFGVLLLGTVMAKSDRYAGVGTLSIVAGAAMVLGGFINNIYLYMASSVATIVWLSWTALSLRAEVGPAIFNFVVRRNAKRAKAA